MKVLLTGSSGLVGSAINRRLSTTDLTLITPSSTELNLLSRRTTMEFIMDVAPEFVIHAAGIVGGIQANIANQFDFYWQNLDMGLNLVNAVKGTEIRCLNFGSSCMYPPDALNPLRESLVGTGKLESTNFGYALAKVSVAQMGAIAHSGKFKTIIPCNIFGPNDNFDEFSGHMIPAVIAKLHRAKVMGETSVSIWGSGVVRREFMYVDDLAEATEFSIANFSSLPAIFNCGVGLDFSINQYYRIVGDVVGYEGGYIHDLEKPEGMKQKLVDVSVLKGLGWVAKWSIEDGVKSAYASFLETIE